MLARVSGHGLPPFCAADTTEREHVLRCGPHEPGHGVQLCQSDSLQSTGQGMLSSARQPADWAVVLHA